MRSCMVTHKELLKVIPQQRKYTMAFFQHTVRSGHCIGLFGICAVKSAFPHATTLMPTESFISMATSLHTSRDKTRKMELDPCMEDSLILLGV